MTAVNAAVTPPAPQSGDSLLALAMAQLPALIWTTDSELRVTSAHGGGFRDAANTPDDLIGQTIEVGNALFHDGLPALHGRALEGESSTLGLEFGHRWYDCSIHPLRRDGEIVGVMGIAHDLTEQRAAAERLRGRERDFETLAEHAPDVIVRYDRELRHVYLNAAAERANGRPREDFLGRTTAELGLSPDRAARWERSIRQVIETGEPATVDLEIPAPSGTTWYEARLVPEPGADGAVESVLVVSRDVTAVKAAEEAVRGSEAYHRALIEASIDVLMILDAEGSITYATPSLEQTLGYETGALIGTEALQLVHPDDRADGARLLTAGISRPDQTRRAEHRVRHEDGSWRTFETVGRSFLDDPAIAGIVVSSRDVSERRAGAAQQQAVAALGLRALAAESLDAILEDAVSTVAETLGVDYASVLELEPGGEHLRFRAATGWPDGLVEAGRVRNAPDNQAGYTLSGGGAVVVADTATEERFHFDLPVGDSGIASGMSVVIGAGDDPFGVLGAHTRESRSFSPEETDFLQAVANTLGAVIRRDAAEARLRRTELRYRTLVEQLPVVTWTSTPGDSPQQYTSPQIEAMLGFPAEEWSEKRFFEQVHPDDLERVREAVPPSTLEFRLLHRDGRVVWVLDHVVPVVNEDGEVQGLQGVKMDITELKESEARLRASEEQFRALFHTTLDAIVIFGDDRLLVDANPAACRLLGIAPDEIVGTDTADLIATSQRQAVTELWQELLKDGELSGELELELQSGGRRQVEFEARANFLPGRHLMTMRDVGDRRRLEGQLVQAQKMEAIGRLAGGVAHDFNNVLLVIRGYTDLLLPRCDGEAAADVREIAAAADRAATLTEQLLAFSRRQVVQPVVLSMNDVLSRTDKMLRRLIGADVELTTVLDPASGCVRADPGQLEQVLLNLAVNARDAMPDGGRLTMETAKVSLDSAASRTYDVQPGTYVALAVSDTGCGMDAETRQHVFEPFFTTKDSGTGLGLATVYGIAHHAGGFVSVYSEPGHGTTFKVYLPHVECPDGSRDADEPDEEAPLLGTETILVLEDDERARHLVAEMLRTFGYTVRVAADGGEALAIAAAAGELDLLLTDVVMPDASGPQVASACLASRPSLRVLFMSGYADRAVADHAVLSAGSSFIQKPFGLAALGRKVREVLDRP